MKSVTVLLPVYNGAAYLQKAVDSILKQSFVDFELLIINDASTDNSEEVIKQINDHRICYYKNEVNIGLVNTLNRGIELAEGKYIARMDQDDYAYPERLYLQYEFLEKNLEFAIVGSHIKFMDSEDVLYYPVSNELVKTQLLKQPAFAHPAVMIRKSILLDNYVRYSMDFQHAEDYGLWVQLSVYGKMTNLDKVLLDYRRHPQQYSVEYKKAMQDAARKARSCYLSVIPVSMAENEKVLFLDIVDQTIDVGDRSKCMQAGILLAKLQDYFTEVELNKPALKEMAVLFWRNLCLKRQSKGNESYFLFLGNKLSLHCNFKLHLWFLKKNLVIVFKKYKLLNSRS